MSSHIRRNISVLLLALIAVLALAACGGGGSSSADVPEGAIAVVGDKTVTKAEFDALMEQQKKSAESQKQDFPAVGTPEYEALKATVVKGLVEQKEWELEGEAMDRARAAATLTDDYVHENPWVAIGAAAATGFLIGLLVTRR